jgi:hypothetical protein
MIDVPTHHIVYGTLNDFITGEELPDTDDERTRQELSKMMVEDLGYKKEDLEPRRFIETLFSSQFVRSNIELTVNLGDKNFMIIRYAPGALVTRERSVVAAARVLEKEYQIPLAVITNGQDAELLDTANGKVLATGMGAIPTRVQAEEMLADLNFRDAPEGKKREGELRILNAFDVQICCR